MYQQDMLGYGQPTELLHFRRIFDGLGSTYDVVKDMRNNPGVSVRNILQKHTRSYVPRFDTRNLLLMILVHYYYYMDSSPEEYSKQGSPVSYSSS